MPASWLRFGRLVKGGCFEVGPWSCSKGSGPGVHAANHVPVRKESERPSPLRTSTSQAQAQGLSPSLRKEAAIQVEAQRSLFGVGFDDSDLSIGPGSLILTDSDRFTTAHRPFTGTSVPCIV